MFILVVFNKHNTARVASCWFIIYYIINKAVGSLQLEPELVTGIFIGCVGGFGVTGGVHRLWTHRSYKAKWPLRVILAVCYSVSGQVRDISSLNFLFALERPTTGILTCSFSPFQSLSRFKRTQETTEEEVSVASETLASFRGEFEFFLNWRRL